MLGAGTPSGTVPEEFQRQSKRINEQYSQLTKILNKVIDYLTDMSEIMGNYSPEVVTQINNLNVSLQSYKTKSAEIYKDVADSLSLYALNLLQNLESLTKSIENIGTSIEIL